MSLHDAAMTQSVFCSCAIVQGCSGKFMVM